MRRKTKAKAAADRQLEDFSPAVLAAFIRQEMAFPFAVSADRLWQKLLRVEAEMEMEKNRAEAGRLIKENKSLIDQGRHAEYWKNSKRIDALWKRNEELLDIAYPDTKIERRGETDAKQESSQQE